MEVFAVFKTDPGDCNLPMVKISLSVFFLALPALFGFNLNLRIDKKQKIVLNDTNVKFTCNGQINKFSSKGRVWFKLSYNIYYLIRIYLILI